MAGLITAISGRCFFSSSSNETYSLPQGECGVKCLAFGSYCGSSGSDVNNDDEEKGVGTSASSNISSPDVISIIASFDAWLFADSKVLWAVLVSKIFEQVC